MNTITTVVQPQVAQPQPKRRTLRRIAAIAGGIALLLAAWIGFML
jgi:hypothetical protein